MMCPPKFTLLQFDEEENLDELVGKCIFLSVRKEVALIYSEFMDLVVSKFVNFSRLSGLRSQAYEIVSLK